MVNATDGTRQQLEALTSSCVPATWISRMIEAVLDDAEILLMLWKERNACADEASEIGKPQLSFCCPSLKPSSPLAPAFRSLRAWCTAQFISLGPIIY